MKSLRKTSALLLAGFAVSACRADPPQAIYHDSAVDLGVQGDAPVGCPARPTIPGPILEGFESPTSFGRYPFRGTAAGAVLMTAKGGAGSAAPAQVDEDGRFCIEVPLVPDATNALTFAGLDRRGCPGQTTSVSIRHQPAPGSDAGTSSANLALGATISGDTPDKGALEDAIDGDASTAVELSFADFDPFGSSCNASAVVRLDLGKVFSISSIRIRWASSPGDYYAACYKVLVSAAAAPGDPAPDSLDWDVVVDVSDGDAGLQSHDIVPHSASALALLLYEDAGYGIYETFQLAELEVVGRDPDATPPAPSNGCF